MVQTRDEREHEIIASQRAIMRMYRATATEALMKIDLSVAQLRTLSVLAEGGAMIIGQVASRLGIGLSTAGHLIDRLVQAELVERTEDVADRRRTLAHLTPKGEDLYTRLLNGGLPMSRWLQKLSDEDIDALLQGLRAIQRVVEEDQSCEKKAKCEE